MLYEKIANFIVNKRLFILAAMVVLTIVSAIFISQVKINDNITKSLPDDSPMKIGLELMELEFPEIEMAQIIRVMFNNLTDTQKQEIKKNCLTLPQGCLCAVLLILIVFPGMLAVFDRFISKRRKECLYENNQ